MKCVVLFLVTCGLLGCVPTYVIEEPTVPNQVGSLGYFALSREDRAFVPYDQVRTLEFTNTSGQIYLFQSLTPVVKERYSAVQIFPHPEQEGVFVEYRYSAQRIDYDFTCNELGARVTLTLVPYLCEDPRLDGDILPESHLLIRGTGFNAYDIQLTSPALALRTPFNQVCGSGQQLGTLTVEGETYTEVTSNQQIVEGDDFFTCFYSPQAGLVGIKTAYEEMYLTNAY